MQPDAVSVAPIWQLSRMILQQKPDRIVYVVDKGLVRFAKFALGVLAIFALVGAFLYGFKIEQAAERVNEAKDETSKARDETSKAKAETQAIKDTVATHQESIIVLRKKISEDADAAKDILRQIRLYDEQEAKLQLTLIESPRITDQQIRSAVDSLLLSRLKDVLTEEQLAKLSSPIQTGPTPLSELLDQPALRLINASDAIPLVTDGAQIRVAIIADPVALDLPQFKGRIVTGEVDTTQDPSGDHGTAVASLIAAVAPKAQLLPLPALTATGGGTDEVVARAIRSAADAKARVICLPLGGLAPSTVQHEAVEYAHGRGALLIAPVGNTAFGGQTPQKEYPAAYDEVLCVASTNNPLVS